MNDEPETEDIISPPETILCEGCGKYFEKSDLKRCRVCGKYFCSECQKTHDCRKKELPPAETPPGMKKCEDCGKYFPVKELRSCHRCGIILCPDCRPHHKCPAKKPLFKLPEFRHEYEYREPNLKNEQSFLENLKVNRKYLIFGGIGLLVIAAIVLAVLFGTGVLGTAPVVGHWEGSAGGLVTFAIDIYKDGTAVTSGTSVFGNTGSNRASWMKMDGEYLLTVPGTNGQTNIFVMMLSPDKNHILLSNKYNSGSTRIILTRFW